jgi:vanillate O-demethylase ferredoxin subunit
MKLTLRQGLVQVHRWTGLTIGLVILMMALTGAVNAFRPTLEPVLNRELLTVPTCSERLPLDTLAANARAAHGRGELDYIRITAGEPGAARMPSTRIRFSDPQEDVYLNPCTGEVLGERARYGGLLGRIEQLHILRYAENGFVRSITAVCAIAFGIVLLGGGLYLFWPRAGSLRSALKIRPQLTGVARRMNLHKTTGVYASAALLVLILTGLPIAFDWYRSGLYTLTGSAQPARSPRSSVPKEPKDAPRLTMQAFWERAQGLMPNVADALLKFPADKPNAPMEGFMIERGAPHANARSLMALDVYSGRTLAYTPYAASSRGHKLYFWMLSLHTGLVGGLWGQLLLFVAALTVPLMAWTGISSFLRRRAQKAGAARPASTPLNALRTSA